MHTIARITAIILIILGLLVILGGLVTGMTGVFRLGSRTLGVTPAQPGLRLGSGLLGGLSLAMILFVQGFVVLATGEGLYLLADLAGKMRTS